MTSGPGGSKREESVQFSLKSLLELEDERVAEQARESRDRQEAILRDREQAKKRAQLAEDAAARAALEAEVHRRRAELEDLARREAMQKALVEQARLEVEVRARAEERERERQHERELQRLRGAGPPAGSSLGALAGASLLGGLVMLLGGLGIHFGVLAPASATRLAEVQTSLAAAEGRAEELSHRLDDQRHGASITEAKLTEARARIAELEPKKLAGGTGPGTGSTVPRSGGPGPSSPSGPSSASKPPVPEKPCLKGDPMCFTFGR